MSDSQYASWLIKEQSQKQDKQFYKNYEFFEDLNYSLEIVGPYDESSNMIPSDIEGQHGDPAMESTNQFSLSGQRHNQSTVQRRRIQVIIPQRQQSIHGQQQSVEQSEYRDQRIYRLRQTYETNNLLPAAKGPHLQSLKQRHKDLSAQASRLIRRLKSRSTITMKDYRQLYSIPDFQQDFEEFFRNKVLYRAIMISRCLLRNKKVFIRKLYIFQKAFRTKIFDRVNRGEKLSSRRQNNHVII